MKVREIINSLSHKKHGHKKRTVSTSSSSSSSSVSSTSSVSSISSSSSSSSDSSCDKNKRKGRKRLRRSSHSHEKKSKVLRKSEKKKMTRKSVKKRKGEECADVPIELMDKTKAMAPMTKEQWENEQNVVKRVYDETTGRHRLVKGNGEIIEEIVSKERHKDINVQATKGDGNYFQHQLGVKH